MPSAFELPTMYDADIIKARTANVSLTNLRYLNLNNSTYGSTTMLMKEVLDAPFLQKLELSGICLPSPIPPLPQLRRLRISRIASGSKNEGMPMTALLSCLLNTPSLEELVVDDALGKLLGKKKDRTTVQLPKLSWISLTTAHVANSTLFQYIQYPASARINFHSTTEPPRGSDIRNLIAIFSHFATSDAAMRINALSLDYDSTIKKHTKVALTATARGVRLSALLPCISIKTLHVGGSPKINRADWSNLLKLYENTRVLEAEDVAPSFLEALLKAPEDEWPPLAEVEEVKLHGCHFDSPYSNPSLTSLVKQLLQERNDLEIPFDVVGISDCYILESTVEELEEYDVRIDWDEETLQKEEEEDEEEEEDDDAEYWRERYY
ncbi:F-box domain-containing protein [Pleurotus pulmonarius]